MQRKFKWPRNAAEDDLVLGIPKLKGKIDTLSKAAPKVLPEEKMSTVGLARGIVWERFKEKLSPLH